MVPSPWAIEASIPPPNWDAVGLNEDYNINLNYFESFVIEEDNTEHEVSESVKIVDQVFNF